MKLLSTALAAALALAGSSCDSLPTSLPGLPGQGGGNQMLDTVKSQPALYAFQLPAGAAVGQAWTMKMGGIEQRTAIVAEKDGQFIVEQTSMMDPNILEVFMVDPTVDLAREVKAGEKMNANVTAAWVGLAGEAPIEREVMAAMEMPEMPAGDAPAVDMEQGSETVSAGGRSWDTEWTEVAGSRTWMANGMVIKSSMNGDTMMELIKWESDAEPALDWSGGDE